jgi:hypothetical protein
MIVYCSCQNKAKQPNKLDGQDVVVQKNCLCKIANSTIVQKYIIPFADTISISQNAPVFKVIFSRRYNFTRINVIPTRYYEDIINDLPCAYQQVNNYTVLFYTGEEQIIVQDTVFQRMLLEKLKKTMKMELTLYNPSTLQIECYGRDSIFVNTPPSNPYDHNFEPQQVIYDFSPPKQKRNN